MIELSPSRKNKITLSDYDYRKDIENRSLMAQFSTLDRDLLEEILYSSLFIPIQKLEKDLNLDKKTIVPILKKLSKTGLFKIEEDTIIVDKEMRKYYESQIVKFEDDFAPGMEFLQSLLRKVPIHVLPIWYCIPRTSNSIFESLVEKYFLTPQIFQRYLQELNFGDPILSGIIDDLFKSPEFKVSSKAAIKKYRLKREQFEEYMLHLEFNFVCCLKYEREKNQWKEIITPFQEWKEYTYFLRTTETESLPSSARIFRTRPHPFSFVQDMATILLLTKKQPLVLESNPLSCEPAALRAITSKIGNFEEDDPLFLPYIRRVLSKLLLLKLADRVDNRLYALETANEWLEMRPENQALFLYRHPLNQLVSDQVPTQLCTERNIREAEKAIIRALDKGWVSYDDFIKGVLVSFSDDSMVMLKRIGKTWKYTLPHYTKEEYALIKATIFEWLFEAGFVETGWINGKECFSVTAFGQALFGR
jgi:predicted transcriptional regulator